MKKIIVEIPGPIVANFSYQGPTEIDWVGKVVIVDDEEGYIIKEFETRDDGFHFVIGKKGD